MRNTFIMYDEWADMIDELTETERGEVLQAIMHYQTDREIPELSPCARVAFAQIKMQFRKDDEKYAEKIEEKREAGRAGGLAKARNNVANLASAKFASENVANLADSVSVSVSDSVSDSDSVCVSDSGVLKNQEKESDLKVTRERFIPPTIDEVREYAAEKGYAIDAEHFVDFYQSKGWMVGKNKMKDWKSAVRNWARQERQGKAAEPKNNNKFNNFHQRDYDFADLESQLLRGGSG